MRLEREATGTVHTARCIIGKSREPRLAPGELAFHQQRPTLLVLSHLRWSFVYQRPQHLMSRFAREFNVLFLEEPIHGDDGLPRLDVRCEENGVQVLTPRLPEACRGAAAQQLQRTLLDDYLVRLQVERPMLWFYTPMALDIAGHLPASLIVYDCMDELSAFRGAPPELVEREQALLQRANLVFTGGYSLWEPVATHIPFGPRFGNQQRPPVAMVNLREDAAERAIIRAGRLVEEGAPRELRHRGGEFEALWRMQAEGFNPDPAQDYP